MWPLLLALDPARLELPPGERPEDWAHAAELAGLALPPGHGEGPVVRVRRQDGLWLVEAVYRERRRAEYLEDAPDTPAEREDALLLGASMLRVVTLPQPYLGVPALGVGLAWAGPRAASEAELGGAVTLGWERWRWHAALELRGLPTRGLVERGEGAAVDVGDAWWRATDLGLSAGWMGLTPLCAWRFDLGAGLSVRRYGQDGADPQADLKPWIEPRISADRHLDGQNMVSLGLGLRADLGPTDLVGIGEARRLGGLEPTVSFSLRHELRPLDEVR